jgi:mRNA-degrading endonuclease RelE of RelBE toxin-antitoxin system
VKLIIEKAGLRGLKEMPARQAALLLERLKRIADSPFGAHPDAKRLVGVADGYRVRQGSWRAVYRIDRTRQTMFVESIANRRDAYR